ncbi:MAG: hypothetical protein ACPGUD_02630 [Parashewanella sp.]
MTGAADSVNLVLISYAGKELSIEDNVVVDRIKSEANTFGSSLVELHVSDSGEAKEYKVKVEPKLGGGYLLTSANGEKDRYTDFFERALSQPLHQTPCSPLEDMDEWVVIDSAPASNPIRSQQKQKPSLRGNISTPPVAKSAATDKALATAFDSAKSLEPSLKQFNFNQFKTVLRQNPQWAQTFINQRGRLDIIPEVIFQLTLLKSEASDVPSGVLPRQKMPTPSKTQVHAAQKKEFETQVRDMGAVVDLNAMHKHLQPNAKTLCIVDVDDTLISRTVKQKYRGNVPLYGRCVDDAVHFAANIADVKGWIDRIRVICPDSRVVVVSNSTAESLDEKFALTGIKHAWFDFIDCKPSVTKGTCAGDKELRINQYCQRSGFKPDQICCIDDEISHFDKIKSIATIMEVPVCTLLHYIGATPHQHSVFALNQVYDNEGSSLDRLLGLLSTHEPYKSEKRRYDELLAKERK